jgi:hypothetical protein
MTLPEFERLVRYFREDAERVDLCRKLELKALRAPTTGEVREQALHNAAWRLQYAEASLRNSEERVVWASKELNLPENFKAA